MNTICEEYAQKKAIREKRKSSKKRRILIRCKIKVTEDLSCREAQNKHNTEIAVYRFTCSTSSLKEFEVTEQIIVGTSFILRAEGRKCGCSLVDTCSLKWGYSVYRINMKHDSSKILEELNAIVDCGGILLDMMLNILYMVN